MSAFRPMAMLSSELLARKGAAVPAVFELQRNGMGPFPIASLPSPRLDLRVAPMHRPQTVPLPLGVETSGSVKVSLRLDADRHRRLRRAVQDQGCSGQRLLVAALDAYLDELATTALSEDRAGLPPRPRERSPLDERV